MQNKHTESLAQYNRCLQDKLSQIPQQLLRTTQNLMAIAIGGPQHWWPSVTRVDLFVWQGGLSRRNGVRLSHFRWIRENQLVRTITTPLKRTSMPVQVFASHNNYNGEYLACGTETCLLMPVIEWKFPAAFFRSPDDTRWNHRRERCAQKKNDANSRAVLQRFANKE